VSKPRWRPGTGSVVAIIVAVVVLGLMIPMPAAVPRETSRAAELPRRLAEPITEHVVVVSIDGLRPDAIEPFGAAEILRMMRRGRYSLQARTILPSNTIPSHTSLVTGVEPGIHGVTWNDRTSLLVALLTLSDRRRQVPTFFDLAEEAGLSSAAVMAKSQMRQLGRPASLDRLETPFFPFPHIKREWTAERVAAELETYLIAEGGRPNLLFLHLADPDLAGHDHGWMSEEYGAAVRRADRALARLLAAADTAFGPDGYTAILTSDHGGLGDGHGGADPREVTIPWITTGRGVDGVGELAMPIGIADTGATALWLLGVPLPSGWTSRPVEAAYSPGAGTPSRPGAADAPTGSARLTRPAATAPSGASLPGPR
jgi:arylsulfatase A-like enzyme